MKTYALIGESLFHSFSKSYFDRKFQKQNISNVRYINIEMSDVSKVKEKVKSHNLSGFNVTIPYKSKIIPFLDSIENNSNLIGAVNTVKVIDGKLRGYNTDSIGFKQSILPFIKNRNNALILGSGGVSKAIKHVLEGLNINYRVVSRNSLFDYPDLLQEDIENSEIIINTTPLGTFPNVNTYPDIPYKYISSKHLLFDVVYNPNISQFLNFGLLQGAKIINGLRMLEKQAEESWIIWNSDKIL